MISRRILRIKVLQAIYSHFTSTKSLVDSEKELFFSIQKSVDLFYYLLLLIIDVKNYALSVMEMRKNKKRPKEDDLNPNVKFIDNQLIRQLEDNKMLKNKLEQKKLSWVQYPEFIRGLFNTIEDSEEYKMYMKDSKRNYQSDKKLIIDIYSKYIIDYDQLYNNLEDQSVFWNSEIDYIITLIIRIFKSYDKEDGHERQLVDNELSESDADYTKRLFRKTIINAEEYRRMIEQFTQNWDIERIAFMDILIMQMTISELIEFSNIPKKVSLNEYIDIAKLFSTKNSAQFINGILDKVVKQLEEEKRIVKKGRGLKENI